MKRNNLYMADGSFRNDEPVLVTHEGLGDVGRRRLTIHTQAGAQHPKSPDGHSWGYGGSGPAQLALDILWDVYGIEPSAPLLQAFKDAVIAKLPQDKGFVLNENDIRAAVETLGGFRGAGA